MRGRRRDEGDGPTELIVPEEGRSAPHEVVTTPNANPVLPLVPVLRSALGPSVSIAGRLSFTVPTQLDGTLRGEVRAEALLVIGPLGSVEGRIRAPEVRVQGIVRGEVRGAERVEIAAGGRLSGAVEARTLVLHDGGILDADCRIGPMMENAYEGAGNRVGTRNGRAERRSHKS